MTLEYILKRILVAQVFLVSTYVIVVQVQKKCSFCVCAVIEYTVNAHLLSSKFNATDLCGTKPGFNDCNTAHVYDEGPDSAKQFNILSLSPNGSLAFVRALKYQSLPSVIFMSQN